MTAHPADAAASETREAPPRGFKVEGQVLLDSPSDDPNDIKRWAAYGDQYQTTIEHLWQSRATSMTYQPGGSPTYDLDLVAMVQRRSSCAPG